jgi:transcriptional regulator with XRE-family HTH domain
MMAPMSTRDRASDRGTRQWARTRTEIGAELREARVAAGFRQSDVARGARTSQNAVSRIERGLSRDISVDTLSRVATVLGLRLSVKLYPDGSPLRNAAQNALLMRLRGRSHPGFRWRFEVPVTEDPADRRAWDAEMSGLGLIVRIDAEVRIRDDQAVARRIALKQRDGGPCRIIIVVAATRANRTVLAAGDSVLRDAYPVDTRHVLACLAAGRDPGSNATVLL